MSKLKISLVVIFIALLSIALIYIFNLNNSKTSIKDSNILETKRKLQELEQSGRLDSMSDDEAIDTVNSVIDELPDNYSKLKRMYSVATGELPDILFYGRIIDQYNQPVQGASVYYSGKRQYLATGGGQGLVRTDNDGYFVIKTTGAALTVGQVIHPDIDVISYDYSGFNNLIERLPLYVSSMHFLPHKKYEDKLSYLDYSSKDTAYMIQAWRLTKYEGARSASTKIGITGDGSTYTINLNKDWRSIAKKGEHDGHFYINCVSEDIETYYQEESWKANLTPINGGIQPTNDLYLNIAPANGYQSEINIDMKKGKQSYRKWLLNQRYYFKINNNYGNLYIHYQPYVDINENGCAITIRYTINETGSRNLEVPQK